MWEENREDCEANSAQRGVVHAAFTVRIMQKKQLDLVWSDGDLEGV